MIVSGENEFLFLPLGGAGEIGMNLNLYGYGPRGAHRWLMVDCGIGFGGDGLPGADVMMSDASFIIERREHLVALVLTHGHEDHLGAVPYLWPKLRCPVYATPFARAILRRKLGSDGASAELRPQLLPAGGALQLGPFALQMIGMTHSLPEARSMAIRTELGCVVHTGDWKLDPNPLVGPVSDEAALRALGDAGVDALICDSTNVFEEGRTGSEGTLTEPLIELVGACRQRAVVTCFASNIARLHSIAMAAQATGRAVVMCGASLKRNYAAARECGYLGDVAPFLEDTMAARLPRERTLVACTGGQGEPRAALMRIARDEHPQLSLDAGDTVIFSSRVIPGNEPAVARLQNALLRLGVAVRTHRHGHIHVSGHPSRGDLSQMYALVRPRVSIPVHGEFRHLLEHATFAREQHGTETIVAENGTMVRLAPGPACVVDHVPTGKLSLEGPRVVALDGELVRTRTKAIYNGSVTVTVAVDRIRRQVNDVQISSIGLLDEGEDHLLRGMIDAVRRAVGGLSPAQFGDATATGESARSAIRRVTRQALNKRPLVQVHVVAV